MQRTLRISRNSKYPKDLEGLEGPEDLKDLEALGAPEQQQIFQLLKAVMAAKGTVYTPDIQTEIESSAAFGWVSEESTGPDD